MKKINLEKDVSPLAEQLAAMKKKATRVNKHVKDPARLPMQSDLAPKEVRGKEGYVPRQRKPGEALPQQHTTLWDKDTYRTGMGDTQTAERPGSMDFMKCKSRGIG